MKRLLTVLFTMLFTLPCIVPVQLNAQQVNCVLQAPIFTLDFGTVKNKKGISQNTLNNYNEITGICPNDGNFSFVSRTSDCFNGTWITINQDHTPGDIEGNMMLVNAAYTPGTFFIAPITGLVENATYELSVWMVNVFRAGHNCVPVPPPQFSFIIETSTGKQLANFGTGDLAPTGAWIQYSAYFKTPGALGPVFLRIINKITGGCGNDFAMDDINIRQCVVPKPAIVKTVSPKPVQKPVVPITKPVVKKGPPALKPVKNEMPIITKMPPRDTSAVTRPVVKIKAVTDIPKPLTTRANPIVKQIETGTAEIMIDLYDNGEIDGDTVSIYHNNELVVSRAALTAKPVSFRLKVDGMHPHHELIMVANNLGSIPPNTSLMIITTRDKRYEVFISSSEQKNAKVVIDLKE